MTKQKQEIKEDIEKNSKDNKDKELLISII